MEHKTNNDEIDLIEVGVKLFVFLKKRGVKLLLFVFIGSILGFSLLKSLPKSYEVEFSGYSPFANELVVKEWLGELNRNLKADNNRIIAENYSVHEKLVGKIQEVETTVEEDHEKSVRLHIRVLLNDLEDPVEVVNFMNSYIAGNKYIQKSLQLREKQIPEAIKAINDQLESLKKSNYKGNGTTVVMHDAANSFITLLNKKTDLEKDMEFLRAFVVLSNSNCISPVKHDIIGYVGISGLIGLLLGLVFYALKGVNNYAAKLNIIEVSRRKLKKTA